MEWQAIYLTSLGSPPHLQSKDATSLLESQGAERMQMRLRAHNRYFTNGSSGNFMHSMNTDARSLFILEHRESDISAGHIGVLSAFDYISLHA